MSEKIVWTTEKVRLGDLAEWDKNPVYLSKHDAEQIRKSVEKFGIVLPLVANQEDGGRRRLIDGHQRKAVMFYANMANEDTLVDVRVPSRRLSEKECEELTIRLRKNTGNWDMDILANNFDLEDLLDWGFEPQDLQFPEDEFETLPEKKPNPRKLQLDIIYTLQGADATCCLAVRAGWLYGCQSPQVRTCGYYRMGDDNHKIQFVDNNYFDYKHDAHVEMVREFRPRYATTRDIMTKEQCLRDGIAHYDLDQILDWAAEVEQYAENVIIIPKYDCIDKIPEKYMLGFSVPTSHGGTPLPVEAFRGRRVHLLGGSWKNQLKYLAELGDDVISLDNNYVAKIARYAQFVTPDGNTETLPSDWMVNNPRYVSLALSFGNIAAKVNEITVGRKMSEFSETSHVDYSELATRGEKE